jgi:glycerophosphoryl diester phosphodiesterase
MWPYPKVLAHRGAGKLAPENTLAAMRCGMEYGYHAVEFDVMLSKDGVPILMHDPEFGRTVQAQGSVATTIASELLLLDAGAWFGEKYRGETVPSYAAVLAFCRANGIFMNVEIKPAPGFEVITGHVVAQTTVAAYGETCADFPLFSSFSMDALVAAQRFAPQIPRGFLTDCIDEDWLNSLRQIEAVSLHTNHKNLTAALAAQAKQAGYGLFCYTVNTLERAQEIRAWGVDAFCTDRIDLIAPDF